MKYFFKGTYHKIVNSFSAVWLAQGWSHFQAAPLLSPLSFLFGLHGRREPGVPAEHTTDKDSDGENLENVTDLKF